MKKKITIVCFAKDEDLYLQEWIDYHLKLGFDSIHIFQNDWTFENKISDNRVYFHNYDGKSCTEYNQSSDPIWIKNIQAKCYVDFAKNYHMEYEWCAFFDVDEYLVLKKTNDVKEFISDYEDYECLIINWAMFGDNDLKDFDKSNTSTLKRFTKRKKDLHQQFKSICKLKLDMLHNIHWNNETWVDLNFKTGNSYLNNENNENIAQLNHYYIRTYPEFLIKRERGNACHGKKPLETFDENNFNEIEDLLAKNFLYNNEK
jgi:hypothetical protein